MLCGDDVFLGGRCRFPLVERAVADVPALADPEFAAGIRGHAENLLKRSRSIPGGAFLPSFPLLLLCAFWSDAGAGADDDDRFRRIVFFCFFLD